MKILFALSINHIKKYKRESCLLVLSIALTISMMAMVSMTMTSLFNTYINKKYDEFPFNASVSSILNVPEFLDEVGRDQLSYYQISAEDDYLYSETEGIRVNLNTYPYPSNSAPSDIKNRLDIIEGRKSQAIHEIVVPKNSPLQINDQIDFLVYKNQEARESITALVVGRNFSDSHYDYYVPEAELVSDQSEYRVDLHFTANTKNVDDLLFDIAESKAELFKHGMLIRLNTDYNFAKGYESTPGRTMYSFVTITLIMLFVVALATFTLILNSFDMLLSQKFKTFSILRSVGATKQQIKLMILIEGLLLTSIGIIAGLILGTVLSFLLINYASQVIQELFKLSGSQTSFSIDFWVPKFMILSIILIGYVVVLFALFKKSKDVYKKSAIEIIRMDQIKSKKPQKSLDKKPIVQLAKINVSTTKDYKGIKTALLMSIIVLITLNAWAQNLVTISSSNTSGFDTIISTSESWDQQTLNQALEEMSLYLKQFENIKKKEFSFTNDIEVDDRKHDIMLQENRSLLSSLDFKIISDESFNNELKALELPKNTNTIFLNAYSKQNESNAVKTMIDFKDEGELFITYTQNNKKEGTTIYIDAVLDKPVLGSPFLNERKPLILTSNSFYNQSNLKEIPIVSGQINMETSLSQTELKEISRHINQVNRESSISFILDSVYFSTYFGMVVEESVSTISNAIFIYIGLVILINIVNISLASYRKRRQEMAMLRSLGAQSDDIQKLFFYELLLTVLKPWLLGVTLGNVINYFIFKATAKVSELQVTNYKFPLKTSLLTLVLIILIVIVHYVVVKAENNKTNLIKAIRSY